MIEYFSDSVLVVKTIELPQGGGVYFEKVIVHEEDEEFDYLLEFECPKSIKCVSGKLIKMSEDTYEIELPYIIMQNIGDVYVQMIKIDKVTHEIVNKSLISSIPAYSISRSIMAGDVTILPEKKEFFDYAVKATLECEKVTRESEILAENLDSAINDINDMVERGDLDGNSQVNRGEWAVGETYYAGNNIKGNNQVSIVYISNNTGTYCYTCLIGGVATITNRPDVSENWELLVFSKDPKANIELIYDYNDKNVINGIAYPQVLPAEIILDLSKYKQINVSMWFYECYMEFSMIIADLYLGKTYGGSVRGKSAMDGAAYCSTEYIVESKQFSTFCYMNQYSDSLGTAHAVCKYAGVKRIEGELI